MKATEQTLQQIERTIRKTTDKFPADPNTSVMTDIHVRVFQDSGELITFDDSDEEITRGLVEQWIDNTDDDFYSAIPPIIRKCNHEALHVCAGERREGAYRGTVYRGR